MIGNGIDAWADWLGGSMTSAIDVGGRGDNSLDAWAGWLGGWHLL